ncbi:MAG: sialidase family protein [Ilumatobacteraceae bacterium]
MRRRTRAGAVAAAPFLALAFAASAFAITSTGNSQANNPQVQGDPSSDTTAVFPTNKQNETTIAQNPIDGRYLIAGSNDEQRQPPCGPGPVRGADALPNDCGFLPGVGTSGIYTSDDSGVSWINRGLLDDQLSWQGLGVVSDGDPVIAYGPKPDARGRFSYSNGVRAYYSSLATISGAKGYEYIIVSHSDDNGATWSAPVVGTTKTSTTDFNDKNWIGVDNSPTSPYFGRVYLSWTEFRSATATGNGSEPIQVAVSANGGASFGSPKQLSPAGNNGTGNGRQGSSIDVGPDGTVYVAFEQGFSQVVAISTTGGAKWNRPVTIGPVADIADPIPGANFRTDSFLTIGADPRPDQRPGSTTVYATWANRVGASGRIVVSTSTTSGRTWGPLVTVSTATEGYAFFQGLDVAPNGRVDIAYQALLATDTAIFGTDNASIDAYAVSKAAGTSTWSVPERISTLSSDPAVSAQNNLQRQFWGDYNQLVSTNAGAVYIATDSRNGVGCPAVDVYQKYLVDNGLVIRGDGADRLSYKLTGVNPALSAPSEKPAPPVDCPPQFGNTDAWVHRFTP